MVDKTISSEETELDKVLIEENPKDFRSLWSRLKQNPNRFAWLGLGVFLLTLPFLLPYLFFGTFVNLHHWGVIVLVAVTMFLVFMWWFYPLEVRSLTKVVMFFLIFVSFGLGFRMMNWDRHVLVDYHERTEDFPYPLVTNELGKSFVGWVDSFTILVKHEDYKFKGPDFTSLATEVRRKKKEYRAVTVQEFKPFTIYYGSDAQGKTGDIRGKRTDYGWFGSTSTDFVIELEN